MVKWLQIVGHLVYTIPSITCIMAVALELVSILILLFNRLGFQCADCGYNVHAKCKSLAPTTCTKHQSLQDQQAVSMSTSTHSVGVGIFEFFLLLLV